MTKLRLIAAVLLALPLIGFGGGYLAGAVPPLEDGTQAGIDLLVAMREGGLMTWVSISHVVVGVLLLVPRTRFASALLQLPISLGMVALHATMLPEGLAPAAVILVLNLAVLADADKLGELLSAKRA